jgi:ABC-2 type transport system permease protein
MNRRRIRTLVWKELQEFRSNPAAVLPVIVLVCICIALPFFVLIVIPRVTGESLGSDRTIRGIVALAARTQPHLARLPPGTAAEAFLFQQFLLLFLVAPIVGAVSLAAYSVVGEKQGRTLEPLLTTPITTAELLIAKVLASFLPSLAVEAVGLLAYLVLVAVFAAPGTVMALLSARSFVMVGLVGPLASRPPRPAARRDARRPGRRRVHRHNNGTAADQRCPGGPVAGADRPERGPLRPRDDPHPLEVSHWRPTCTQH